MIPSKKSVARNQPTSLLVDEIGFPRPGATGLLYYLYRNEIQLYIYRFNVHSPSIYN